MNHPNIATLYEAVETDDETVLVLEYLPGGTRASRLASVKSGTGDLTMADSLAIAINVAEGLAHAHRNGVVDRDLKPSNLMFDAEGRVKITDFGLSKLEGGEELTRSDAVLGTERYMSPEQRRGDALGLRPMAQPLGRIIVREHRTPGFMRLTLHGGLLAIVISQALCAASFEADSKRGAALFREQMCTNCHTVAGEGKRSVAPDLARRIATTHPLVLRA